MRPCQAKAKQGRGTKPDAPAADIIDLASDESGDERRSWGGPPAREPTKRLIRLPAMPSLAGPRHAPAASRQQFTAEMLAAYNIGPACGLAWGLQPVHKIQQQMQTDDCVPLGASCVQTCVTLALMTARSCLTYHVLPQLLSQQKHSLRIFAVMHAGHHRSSPVTGPILAPTPLQISQQRDLSLGMLRHQCRGL